MKFSNVRLLVKDFAKCFKFYSEQLGLEPAWGDENSGYAYFKVADGIEGFAPVSYTHLTLPTILLV